MVNQSDLYLTYNNIVIEWQVFFGVFFDQHFYEYTNSLPIKVLVNYRIPKNQLE